MGALGLLLPSATLAQDEAKDPLVAEGVALHDKGEFDQAIAKYQEALDRNPKNIGALYEMTYSYYAKHDRNKTLELAQKGAKVDSRLRASFLMMVGNVQDELENPKAAIKAYEEAIKYASNISLLHFNLGVTYLGQKEWRKARVSLQRDISLNQSHASGHLRLGQVYQQEGFKVPAFLAYLRFLTLEPTGPRAKFAAENVDRLMNSGYSKDEKGNIQISLSLGSQAMDKEEGDFGGAEMIMQMAHAADDAIKKDVEKQVPLPEPAKTLRILTSTITMIGETAGQKSGPGFAVNYYVPYFAALGKDPKLVEAAGYVVWQSREISGLSEWIANNPDAVKAFKAWSDDFKWPAPPKS